MRRKSSGRLLAAASLVVLLGTACTPDAATQPTPSPTPAVASPPETAQEREQRLAYAAAEKSYKAFRLELRRVTAKGGSAAATAEMKATAAGPYLADQTKIVQAFNDVKAHTTGMTTYEYIRPGGYSPASLQLDVCENERGVTTFDRSGKAISHNGLLQLAVDVRLTGGSWKVWDTEGSKVESCA